MCVHMYVYIYAYMCICMRIFITADSLNLMAQVTFNNRAVCGRWNVARSNKVCLIHKDFHI